MDRFTELLEKALDGNLTPSEQIEYQTLSKYQNRTMPKNINLGNPENVRKLMEE